MRFSILAVSLILAASPALADECLNMKDASSTHFVNDTTMTVQTKQSRNYTITFKDGCPANKFPLTHFVYEQWTLQCVSAGAAFPTNGKGPCFVKSVVQTSS